MIILIRFRLILMSSPDVRFRMLNLYMRVCVLDIEPQNECILKNSTVCRELRVQIEDSH